MRAGNEMLLLMGLYGLEKAHLDRRLEPLLRKPTLLWALLATAAALAAIVAFLKARRRTAVIELDVEHLDAIEEVNEAMKHLPDAVDAMREACRRGLERVRGSGVECMLTKDRRYPPGISESGGLWSYRTGSDGSCLVFVTGGKFSRQDILLLEETAEKLDIVLTCLAYFDQKASGGDAAPGARVENREGVSAR